MNSNLQTLDFQEDKCNNCHSIKWGKTQQGDIACLCCGIKCSLGYISLDEEEFIDIEQPNKLLRINRTNAEFNNSYQLFGTQSIPTNDEDIQLEKQSLELFDKCILLFPFSQKEIFLERINFQKEIQNSFIVQTDKYIKQFCYSYFINLFISIFGYQQQEEYREELKNLLRIKEQDQVKIINTNNQPIAEEKFIYLINLLYPQTSEVQNKFCLLRLEEVQDKLNSLKSTKICVAAYDLLVNYFKVKKIDIENIIDLACEIYNWKKRIIKPNTIKRNHKLLTQSQHNKSYQI